MDSGAGLVRNCVALQNPFLVYDERDGEIPLGSEDATEIVSNHPNTRISTRFIRKDLSRGCYKKKLAMDYCHYVPSCSLGMSVFPSRETSMPTNVTISVVNNTIVQAKPYSNNSDLLCGWRQNVTLLEPSSLQWMDGRMDGRMATLSLPTDKATESKR